MKQEIMTVLTRSRRKLLFSRLVEAGALGSLSAALSGGLLQLAWSVGRVYLLLAIAISAMAVIAGFIVARIDKIRDSLHLDARESMMVGLACAITGIAGIALLASGFYLQIPKIWIPVVAWLAGAVWGAGWVIARPVSLVEAGVFMDSRWQLSEKLATAGQLAQADESGAVASCVYKQACEAALRADVTRGPMWVRSPALLGGVILAGLLSITLGAIPLFGLSDNTNRINIFARNLDDLSPAQRMKLAQSLRDQAREVGSGEISDQLNQIARKVEMLDKNEVKKLLELLAQAGLTLDDLVAEDLLAGAGASSDGAGKTSTDKNDTHDDPKISPVDSDGAVTAVYNPQYKIVAGNGSDKVSQDHFISVDDAWKLARRKAQDVSSQSSASPQRRQLLRDYFDTGERR